MTYLRLKVRNLLQWRIRVPARLDAHLRQIHGTERTHPRIRAHNVHTCAEKVEHFLKYEDLIGGKVRWELQSAKVCLQEEECLEVRSFEVGFLELDGYTVI